MRVNTFDESSWWNKKIFFFAKKKREKGNVGHGIMRSAMEIAPIAIYAMINVMNIHVHYRVFIEIFTKCL